MKTEIQIYTDGACSGNPGPGGTGYLIFIDNIQQARSGTGYRHTTNNRMEIKAVIEGLNKAKYLYDKFNGKRDTDVKVTVYSDSQLVVNTMNNGWAKKTNNDLWEALDKALEQFNRKVKFVKVKGHANNNYNIIVDETAVAHSKNPTKIDSLYEQINKPQKENRGDLLFTEPEIKNIAFCGENTPDNRHINVLLTNGTTVTISRLYEGFQCTGCTQEESRFVTHIAFKYIKWLNGKQNF